LLSPTFALEKFDFGSSAIPTNHHKALGNHFFKFGAVSIAIKLVIMIITFARSIAADLWQ